ncbi:hypothetical protein [Lysobacter gummosus]|uniref:hypothetical protein n=1 Tax=Lysobacter gummosus TaxID=262324 RepID=UPI003633651B
MRASRSSRRIRRRRADLPSRGDGSRLIAASRRLSRHGRPLLWGGLQPQPPQPDLTD